MGVSQMSEFVEMLNIPIARKRVNFENWSADQKYHEYLEKCEIVKHIDI